MKKLLKKKFKVFFAIIACVVMVVGNTMVTQAKTNHTQQEALQWVRSQVGKGIEFNNDMYKYQCVDLIMAYYNYLGMPVASGNGSDYTWNALPDGWRRIKGAVPQPGDILVYTGGYSNYGHVAIFESTTVTYHQNYSGHPWVERVTGIRYDGFKTPYWGVIRPDFKNIPTTVSFSWTNERCEYDTTNAFVYAEAKTNVSGSFTQAGFTLWDETGKVVATKTENPSHTGSSLEIWYNITNETGVTLKPGTNYRYQIYTTFNGKQYKTNVKSFRTRGQSTNSWTKELKIDNWTYGKTASVPTAAAKYGKPTFTYSTEKNGTYTSEVPTKAGTYYVKATVPATTEYTGLTAIKEFQINKATPQFVVPENITMIYGQSFNDVELPDGFAWLDGTELSGPVGEKVCKALFTPEDTANYNTVKDIRIPVKVQPKDLSDMQLTNIDKNTDLNKYEIKDGDITLVKDADYTISSVTKDNTVTVFVEFTGNYTGKTQTTYSLKDTKPVTDENDGDNDKVNSDETDKNTEGETKKDTESETDKNTASKTDKDTENKTDKETTSKKNKDAANKSKEQTRSVKTGDDANIRLWLGLSFMAVLGIVLSVVIKRKKLN